MITLAVLVILGVLLGVVLAQLAKKPAAKAPAAGPENLADLKVADARAGDAISVFGAGDDAADLDFIVERVGSCEAGTRRWVEIEGSYRERRVALRVSVDPAGEAALDNGARRIALRDLSLSEDDMAEMDERQNTGDSFEFDGAVWLYRFSREARCWRDGAPVRGFYYWQFEERDGNRLLSVSKPEGEPFTASLYAGLRPGDVNIYRGKA